MKSKEKAQYLVDGFSRKIDAIMCCEEILKEEEKTFRRFGLGFMGNAISRNDFTRHHSYKFYNEVIQEIKNL